MQSRLSLALSYFRDKKDDYCRSDYCPEDGLPEEFKRQPWECNRCMACYTKVKTRREFLECLDSLL